MTAVHDLLCHSPHTPAVLVESAPLSYDPSYDLSHGLSYDLDDGLLEVAGRRVRPVVVWARHAAALTLAAHTTLDPVPAAAWSGLIAQVAFAAPVSLPGRAPRGTAQLASARRLGVPTPRTVLTTDVRAAVRRLRAPRVVVKTPDFRLADADRRNWPGYLPEVGPAPAAPADGRAVVVQEYVPHARELRVFHLAGGLCAFQVDKPTPAAQWTDPESVTVTAVDCPPAAAEVVRVLCAAWRLRYGAFDLLLRPDGGVVFLEANPDGDWLWYERRAGRPGLVSFMAAAMVRELFARTTSRGTRDDA